MLGATVWEQLAVGCYLLHCNGSLLFSVFCCVSESNKKTCATAWRHNCSIAEDCSSNGPMALLKMYVASGLLSWEAGSKELHKSLGHLEASQAIRRV